MLCSLFFGLTWMNVDAFAPRGLAAVRLGRRWASVEEQTFVDEFKMITEDEATVRKIAGVAIGVVTAAMFAHGDSTYGSLSAGALGAISTFRTGASYQ